MDRQRGLDQPGHAGGALGVTDLRLHRAEHAAAGRGAGATEHIGERRQLGAIADHGAGAVGLDQADLGRRHPGLVVRALDGADLAFLARRGEPEALAVAGAGHALDDRVDAIAVALGVGHALEHQRGDALAEHDAVRRGVERVAATGGRQRVHAREQQVVVDAVVQVGAAAHHGVAGAEHQLLDREIDRGERRRARGVDGEVGAAEIEPVGDATGDHVGQHAGERVLGQRRQRGVELGRQRADVVREHRAEAVRARQVGAGLGAEDHRGALAIERAAVRRHRGRVAGVVEGAPRDLEAEQLHRLDRFERARRDAVGQRIERHRLEEAAPLARGLLAGAGAGRRGVVELLDAPPRRRHLAHAVLATDDVGPEAVGVGGAGEDAGEPDDRDVDRRGVTARHPRRRRQRGGALDQERLAVGADLVMQLGDRAGRRAQRRDLPDHVHAVAGLGRRVDGHHRRAVAAQALARHPQPAQVQLLERGPPLLRRRVGGGQPRFLGGELRGERGVGAARGVTGRGLEERRRGARDRRLLEPGLDRPRRHRLVGEQVRGAHQHADLGAARGQRRRHRRHHRARARVVDAAGEQDAGVGDGGVGEQLVELRFPQREAGARADVTAALAALEHEATRAVAEEQVEQARRRHVQVGRDARGLERRGLRRPTAGDQRQRRLDVAQHRELLLAQLGRHEAEDADAPRPIAQARRGFGDQRADLGARRQRQREERQATAGGHRLGERRAIAHARHRALRDRIAHAVGHRERRVGPERRQGRRRRDLVVHGRAHAAHRGGHRAEPLREAAGQRAVLTDRHQVRGQRVTAEPRDHLGGVEVAERRHRQIGPREHAVPRDHRGLAAVHRRQRAAHVGGQRRLAAQRELAVEHYAGRAAGDARRGGVHADAALGPHRHAERRDQLLHQHERRRVADPTAGLVALGDHADRAGRDRGVGLVERGHLHQHRAPRERRHRRGGRDDHGVGRGGQLVSADRRAVRKPDREARDPMGQRGQRPVRARGVVAEVEHPERAGARGGRHHARIGALERRQHEDGRQGDHADGAGR